ncbi:MAG: hypothetical protein ACODAQ_10475, partial [Phycisphaeraceae bacterium]
SGLCEMFDRCVRNILDARISSRKDGIGFVEQAALSLAVVRAGLRYELWPHAYNYNVGHGIERYYRDDELREAHVLHYHNYMRSDAWPRLLGMLQSQHPEVAKWLSTLGPVDEPRARRPHDMLRSAFKAYRMFRRVWYERAASNRPTRLMPATPEPEGMKQRG